MRNPERIKPHCDKLAAIWEKVSDWRFTQLIYNAAIAYRDKFGRDSYYVEDEKFFQFLDEYIREINKST